MTNRNTNLEWMAQRTHAWKALGRWQALNARLSREALPLTSGWARPSSENRRLPGAQRLRPQNHPANES